MKSGMKSFTEEIVPYAEGSFSPLPTSKGDYHILEKDMASINGWKQEHTRRKNDHMNQIHIIKRMEHS